MYGNEEIPSQGKFNEGKELSCGIGVDLCAYTSDGTGSIFYDGKQWTSAIRATSAD